MSDLIEILKTYYEKASDAKSQNAAMIYEDKFRELCWTAAPEILSALETVRGIEGLAESGFVRIENGIMNQWHVTTNREWRSDQQETDALTLSAAVKAARKRV